MRGLTGLAWRSVAARRVRSGLTIIGIAVGVAVLYAALATNSGIDAAIDRTVAGMVGRASLRIATFHEAGLSPGTLRAIQDTPGVAVAAPAVERRSYLGADLGAPGTASGPVTVLGIDPALDPAVHDLAVVRGSGLVRPTEPSALITERLAADRALDVGSEIELIGSNPDPEAGRFRVVGILAGEGPLVGAFGRTIVLPIDKATGLFELAGVSRADIALDPGTSTTDVVTALEGSLTSQPYVLSSPDDMAASLRASAVDFQATTALIAAIALFVGAFLIFNTLSMMVAERIREVGLLRAAGTTRRQVIGFILTQAGILGVLGSVLGIIAGFGLALVAAAYLHELTGLRAAPEIAAAPPAGFAIALTAGVLVTMAAALEPALRASRISPIEALKPRLEPGGGRGAELRWLVGVFLVVAVAGLTAWPRGANDAGLGPSFAVFGLLLGVTLASPILIGPLGRIAGLPFSRLARLEERLARVALVRDRSRTALTVGALTVGLAMIVAVGGISQNSRRAASAWLVDVIPGDEIVTAITPVPVDDGPPPELSEAPGVARVTAVATFDIAFRGKRLDAAAVSGADLLDDGRLTFVSGDRAAALAALDAGGTAVLPAAQADRLGIRVGDTMSLVGVDAPVELRIAGIADRTLPGTAGESVLVGWADARALGVVGADFFAVRFEPGSGQGTRDAFETAARSIALEPSTLERVEGAISDALGQMFGLFDALALVAVVVAGLGIINTLTMNVLERVREIGVLRAAGMTRRQVRRMVVVEASVLGLVGAFLGIITGLAVGVALAALIGGVGSGIPLEVPWATVAFAAVFGFVVATLAAWYPARLASNLSIVQAVKSE
jgi:putative ABC transport system permease protein